MGDTGPGRWGSPLLNDIRGIDPGAPAVVLVRHSAREALADLRTGALVPLSPEGRDAARLFGSRLPAGRAVTLRHSFVERCRQTARLVARGVGDAGGSATVEGPHAALAGPYLRDVDVVADLSARMGPAFVRAWFDGRVPADAIAPIGEACGAAVRLAEELLASAAPGDLHLLVTHDWNVMAVREGVLGLRHEDVGWVEFLDGVVFVREGDAVTARWRGHAARS